MPFTPAALVSFLVAVSFAAGLNVYATTAALGILQRLHWIDVPAGLTVLASPLAIAASVVLFLVEVFGDKIPYIDLLWNAVHTFVRVPVAALLAFKASAPLPPEQQVLITLLAGVVAAIAHGAKSSTRVLVSASPEPVSNIALSSAEDIAAVGLTWFATHHPYVAGGVAAGCVLAALLLVRTILRLLRRGWHKLHQHFNTPQMQA